MGAGEFGSITWADPPPEEVAAARGQAEVLEAHAVYAEFIRIRQARSGHSLWSANIDITAMMTVESGLFTARALTFYRYCQRLTRGEGAIGTNVFWNAVIASPQAVMADAENWQNIQAQRQAAA